MCHREEDYSSSHRHESGLEIAIDENNELEVRRIMAHDKTFDDVKNDRFHNDMFPDGYTLLHWAAYNDYRLTARALIARGVKVHVYTDEDETPLHYACEKGHIEMVRILLDNGAQINAMDESNITPLADAMYNDHIYIAMLLIERGAIIPAVCREIIEDGGMTFPESLIWKLEQRIKKRKAVIRKAIAHDKPINDKEMKFIEILKGK